MNCAMNHVTYSMNASRARFGTRSSHACLSAAARHCAACSCATMSQRAANPGRFAACSKSPSSVPASTLTHAAPRTILPWIRENPLRGSSVLTQKLTLHYSEQRADSGRRGLRGLQRPYYKYKNNPIIQTALQVSAPLPATVFDLCHCSLLSFQLRPGFKLQVMTRDYFIIFFVSTFNDFFKKTSQSGST